MFDLDRHQMKLTDYLAKQLQVNGIKTVFGLQGGAVVHIFDSFEKYGMNVFYTHHEQTASLAATANSKVTDEIGCAVVTTGPGSTNAITGLLGAWQDSIPVIFISGQVRDIHMSYGKKVRQIGTQEANIIDVVKPITKKVFLIKKSSSIIKILNEAINVCISDRPGPVWIDVPLNFQWENIHATKKDFFKVKKNNSIHKSKKSKNLQRLKITNFSELLKSAKNPLIVLGYGIRLSKSIEEARQFIKKHNFQFVTTWTASDIFETKEPLNLGIIGMRGQRGANIAIFKADLIICLGTHLSISQTSTLTKDYAPKAKKIIVDVDKEQLKNLNIKFDLKINMDLKDFFSKIKYSNFRNGINKSFSGLKNLNWYYPIQKKLPNPNVFFRELTKKAANKTCIIVDGGGTALYTGFQSSYIRLNQRIICSSAISSMGTALAETIGTYTSNKFKKFISIIGDGSFLMNIQDLQSIKSLNIPVVICVINNNGYLAIRHTQKEFLNGNFYGTHPKWSLEMPSIKKIAKGFDIDYLKLDKSKNIISYVEKLIKKNKPIICEVIVDEEEKELFSQGYLANKDGSFTPLSLDKMEPKLELK